MRSPELSFDKVAAWLSVARRIVVLSGAGLSKGSGIPTYRDSGGLWTNASDLKFSEASAFDADPKGFLDFWATRRGEMSSAQPNAAHRALVELQKLRPSTTLITQNVDGLLTRGGAIGVLELHGALDHSFCTQCGARDPAQHNGVCLVCNVGGRRTVRPSVVMFGEQLDPKTLALAEWKSKQADVFISVGTTALVYPAAGLAERAQARGAKLVVVNVEETAEDRKADAVLRGAAEVVLPALLQSLKSRRTALNVDDKASSEQAEL
jgi:NAD-dependent deacetylase